MLAKAADALRVAMETPAEIARAVAAALKVPTVAIFGSTDSVATGPRGKNARVVKQDLECSPCLKPECSSGYRCLLAVQPEDVWREMEKLRAESTEQGAESQKQSGLL